MLFASAALFHVQSPKRNLQCLRQLKPPPPSPTPSSPPARPPTPVSKPCPLTPSITAWPRPSPLTSPSPARKSCSPAHLESYRKAYAPANQPEADLVRTLAESYWRLERAHKLENALFHQILQQDDYKDLDPTVAKAVAWSNKDTGLQRLALYAQRIQRTAEKTTNTLKAMQQERKAAYNQAKEEAMYLTQLSLASGNSFEPAIHFGAPDLHGGFVYSPDEIKLALLRVSRLEEARSRFSRAGRRNRRPRAGAARNRFPTEPPESTRAD